MCVLVHVHLSIQQTFPWDLCPVQGLLAWWVEAEIGE